MGCSSSRPAPEAGGKLQGVGGDSLLDASNSKNLRAKLVLLGDSGVGKSCIVLRFVRGQFDPSSKFEIWDTAGQERYASLAPLYYRGAAAAIVAFDITSAETFSKAKFWVKELQQHGASGMVLALVGNKADLIDQLDVALEEVEEYAASNGMFYIQTSAKTAENVNELFEQIATKLPRGRPTTLSMRGNA
eukprot:jgi/Mesen1/3928/ME000209S02949